MEAHLSLDYKDLSNGEEAHLTGQPRFHLVAFQAGNGAISILVRGEYHKVYIWEADQMELVHRCKHRHFVELRIRKTPAYCVVSLQYPINLAFHQYRLICAVKTDQTKDLD